jgi:hypothetical protein
VFNQVLYRDKKVVGVFIAFFRAPLQAATEVKDRYYLIAAVMEPMTVNVSTCATFQKRAKVSLYNHLDAG